jgi:hypothetical protein
MEWVGDGTIFGLFALLNLIKNEHPAQHCRFLAAACG